MNVSQKQAEVMQAVRGGFLKLTHANGTRILAEIAWL